MNTATEARTHNIAARSISRVLHLLSDTMLYDVWSAIGEGYTETDKQFSTALTDELVRRGVLNRKPEGGAELS
jgi:hypothetical protein